MSWKREKSRADLLDRRGLFTGLIPERLLGTNAQTQPLRVRDRPEAANGFCNFLLVVGQIIYGNYG